MAQGRQALHEGRGAVKNLPEGFALSRLDSAPDVAALVSALPWEQTRIRIFGPRVRRPALDVLAR